MPSPLRNALMAPYRAVFYAYLTGRRAYAFLRPASGGAWRTWVTPHLLLGGFLAPHDVAALAREGVGAVVNVSNELLDPRRGLENAGIAYHRIPCWDMRTPSFEDAHRGVEFIAEHVAAGRKVHVHCASGVGRSVSILLCYLAAHEGADIDAALSDISRLRPRVSLSRAQRAFVDDYVGWRNGRKPA